MVGRQGLSLFITITAALYHESLPLAVQKLWCCPCLILGPYITPAFCLVLSVYSDEFK